VDQLRQGDLNVAGFDKKSHFSFFEKEEEEEEKKKKKKSKSKVKYRKSSQVKQT